MWPVTRAVSMKKLRKVELKPNLPENCDPWVMDNKYAKTLICSSCTMQSYLLLFNLLFFFMPSGKFNKY